MSDLLEVPIYPRAELDAPQVGPIDLALGAAALGVIREIGFVNLRLSPAQEETMEELFAAGEEFFSQSLKDKMNHVDDLSNRAVGYRPHGAAYDRKMNLDENDSFITRMLDGEEALIPGEERPKATRLIAAMGSFRDLIAVPTVQTIDAALADYYDYPYSMPFREGSVVQVNNYCLADERKAEGIEHIALNGPDSAQFQGEHEDGDKLTVLSSNWHGLVGRTNTGVYIPISHGSKGNRAISVFGSGVLEDATAGEIKSFRHKAYNYMTCGSDVRRLVPTYFSSPDTPPGVAIPAYKGSQDVATSAQKATAQFGIGENFVNRPTLRRRTSA